MNYEIDELIRTTLERQQTVEQLNRTIMKDVRRRARRAWLRRWGRIAAFSFGLPLVLLVFVIGMVAAIRHTPNWPIRYCLVIPVVAMLHFAWYEMKHFSAADV